MVKITVQSSRSNRHVSTRRLLAIVAPLALVLGACGSESNEVASDALVVAEEANESASAQEPADEEAPAGSEEAPAGDETAADSEPATKPVVEPLGAVIQENGPIAVTGEPLAVFDSTIPDDTIGTAAPVIAGQGFDGRELAVGGPTDNPTMVVFLAHWCPHCNDEIPELISLNDAGSLPDDLVVVGVSTAVDPNGSNFPPSEWIVDKAWPWETMADDEDVTAIAAMGGSSFPFTVILDTEGNVLARKGGAASAAETLDFINSALG